MRIISGLYKGRTIKAPSSKFTRPTTDRVRETLFNILNNYIDFENISVLDIYSGSGALGIETLSRGAEKVHFVEKNFPVYNILKGNIDSLGESINYKIFKMEAVSFSNLSTHETYDLILADPPFFKDDIHFVVKNLINNSFLAENGIIIVERSKQTLEKDVNFFKKEPFKKIGDTLLYWFNQDDVIK